MSNTIVGKIIILLSLIVAITILLNFGSDRQKVYDCGMAEWHPDIPIKIKEECRKLRQEQQRINQEIHQPKSTIDV